MHMRTSTVLPLKSEPVVCCSQDANVEYIDELAGPVIKKPISDSWFSVTADMQLELQCGWSGQMRRASSGHWPSAALRVKNTVGSPRVSTIEISLLLCLNQY